MKSTRQKVMILFVMAFAMNMKAQDAFMTTSGEAKSSGGSVSYSVGQIVDINQKGTNGSVSQGVQQPYEISVVYGEIDGIDLKCTIYPNPTVKSVTLNIEDFNSVNFAYYLFNVNGKNLASDKIYDNHTVISLENFEEGLYFIKVVDKEKHLKTFKILKRN